MKKIVFLFTIMANVYVFSGCSGDGDSGNNQYLLIKNAVFMTGTPTGTQTTSTIKPTVTGPSTTMYLVNTPVTWKVDFSTITEIDVTEIIIQLENTSGSIDGYFVYPLTDAEIAAGYVDIETELVDTEPETTQVCNRDYRGNGVCYEKANEGVTNMDFAAAAEPAGAITYSPSEKKVATVPVPDTTAEYCSEWISMCSCYIRACATEESAWYDVGTGVYNCNGLDCTTAAQNAAAWCTRGC